MLSPLCLNADVNTVAGSYPYIFIELQLKLTFYQPGRKTCMSEYASQLLTVCGLGWIVPASKSARLCLQSIA